MEPIDFWLSMGSTYTYLTVSRLADVQHRTGVSFRWHPFNLLRLLNVMETFPFKEGTSKTRYMWQDLSRRASQYGLPLQLPVTYPSRGSALANRVAIVGIREGWAEAFATKAYRLWFTENLPNGTEENLARSLREIGQDHARVVAEAQRDEIGQLFESETDVAKDLGIFGSPTFVVRDQLFWGDDRLDDAIGWYRRLHAN